MKFHTLEAYHGVHLVCKNLKKLLNIYPAMAHQRNKKKCKMTEILFRAYTSPIKVKVVQVLSNERQHTGLHLSEKDGKVVVKQLVGMPSK